MENTIITIGKLCGTLGIILVIFGIVKISVALIAWYSKKKNEKED